MSKLALLNKQLIDDEKSDNPMNINELEIRMKGFLETDFYKKNGFSELEGHVSLVKRFD